MAGPFIRLFGAHPSTRLVQSTAFPNGEADGSAMIELGHTEVDAFDERWCSNYCPGDKLLVSGHVLALNRAASGENEPIQLSSLNANASTALPVKILVRSCGRLGGTIIDSDRQLVADGPKLSVAVLVPAGWISTDGSIPPPVIEEQSAWDVALYLSVCPVKCCYPPLPSLTWWVQLQPEATAAQRTFVRPRQARALLLPQDAGGGINFELWSGDPAAGGIQVGHEIAPAGAQRLVYPWGAVSHLRVGVPVMQQDVLMRWEIG